MWFLPFIVTNYSHSIIFNIDENIASNIKFTIAASEMEPSSADLPPFKKIKLGYSSTVADKGKYFEAINIYISKQH